MGTKYRVDRNTDRTSTPLGMNSLLYLGNDRRAATRAYNLAQPGTDPWGRPNDTYGVTLAEWRGPAKYDGDYVVRQSKFLHVDATAGG